MQQERIQLADTFYSADQRSRQRQCQTRRNTVFKQIFELEVKRKVYIKNEENSLTKAE